jgi:predicted transcriptional regulator of viral defense system
LYTRDRIYTVIREYHGGTTEADKPAVGAADNPECETGESDETLRAASPSFVRVLVFLFNSVVTGLRKKVQRDMIEIEVKNL